MPVFIINQKKFALLLKIEKQKPKKIGGFQI